MDPRVFKLVQKEKIVQRSSEWYEKRKTMITASSAANLLVKDDKVCDSYINEYKLHDTFVKDNRCANPYSSKKQYILDKCVGSKFKGSAATYHGQKYEEIVTDIYRIENNTEVMEFGILTHPKYSWLGASPDGITPQGIMLEIKCPYRRAITGVPPFYYWIQVQFQLEVCDLDYCDFVEYQFIEVLSKEEFLDDTTLESKIYNKGAVVTISKLKDGEIDYSQNEYIYLPKEIYKLGDEKIVEWYEHTIKEYTSKLKEEYRDTIRISGNYWKVTDRCITRIKRDKQWFENILPSLEKAWEEIEYYKMNDNHRILLKRQQKEYSGDTLHLDVQNTCILTDDET